MSVQVEAAQSQTIKYKNGDKYVGEVKNGKRNGYGTLYYSNGNVYTGEFKNDKKDGYGSFVFKKKKRHMKAISRTTKGTAREL